MVTGPVLNNGPYLIIGPNEVAVPKHYFKAILDYAEPEIKMIGFVFRNEKSDKGLAAFAVAVNEIENFTGIDFFHAIPDPIEEILEFTFELELWDLEEVESEEVIPVYRTEAEPAKFWINSDSNTRHNQDCRYYGNTKEGYYTDQETGDPCGICGG